MIYTFSCPAPCQRLICVDARDDEEAVVKFIGAGAMLCRNRGKHDNCPMVHPDMTPLPDMRLREIVRLSMRSGA